MSTSVAVVFESPGQLSLREIALGALGPEELLVDVEWSGISTGTEKLLYSGRMPPFPGLAYPLVPGYETIGRVVDAGPGAGARVGERVFVPGAACFGEVRGLFGGAASRLRVPSARALRVGESLEERGVLLALAATAYHAIASGDGAAPELVVGHGALGRLLARVAVAMGHEGVVVWERDEARREGARGYRVVAPEEDERRDYRSIYDVSGDPSVLDGLIARLAPRGEVVLAGFYHEPVSFGFPVAFMKEARLRVSAEWKRPDLDAVLALAESGRLELDELVTHVSPWRDASGAYRTAFSDPRCLKMILDWRSCER